MLGSLARPSCFVVAPHTYVNSMNTGIAYDMDRPTAKPMSMGIQGGGRIGPDSSYLMALCRTRPVLSYGFICRDIRL